MNLLDRIAGGSDDLATFARANGRRAVGRRGSAPNRWPAALALLGGGLLGAALMYFLDPSRGRSRRARYGDQIAGTVRRGVRRGRRGAAGLGSTAEGKIAGIRHRRRREPGELNDADLQHAVESELFRDSSIPKGLINVNAERGVIVLRGEVGSPEQRDELARRVEDMPGVLGVRNLLHLPGAPAVSRAP